MVTIEIIKLILFCQCYKMMYDYYYYNLGCFFVLYYIPRITYAFILQICVFIH